ncbi:ubinuclein-1 isoform X2 [Prorops nasuta]|uniref:ubinuclein-1 isoform X2 n=1 Tax=Prorops nasuta TaxID=863751 RepID=UPI0034CEE939
MSEAKRIPLQTLEFPESLGHAAKKEKKGEKGNLAPSFRFTLALPESNEKACPEFNYAQLLKAAEKKRKKENKRDENTTNGLDPLDDEEDDAKLRDMARRFEAKYGTAYNNKKRHKNDAYVDVGAGYDENDSFIDNTDFYDEIVPEDVTTAHGGFYINCGALEFKEADGQSLINLNDNNNDDDESSLISENDTEGGDSPKRRNKRILSSSDDEDMEENANDQPRKKPKLDENVKKKSADNVVKKKKSHHHPPSDQPRQNLQNDQQKIEAANAEGGGTALEDQEERKKLDKEKLKSKTNMEKKFDIKKIEKKFDIKKLEKKSSSSNTNGFDAKRIEIRKVVVKDSNVDNAIERVVNAARRVEDESSRDTLDSPMSNRCAGSESEAEEIDKEDGNKDQAPLPDSLPEDIKEIINKLKLYAETCKEGKNKFINPSVNSSLFSLEKKLRLPHNLSLRTQTYCHLASFLPYSKATLASKAKKLYLQDADRRVLKPVQRLEALIEKAVPSVMEKYQKEVQKVAEENPQLYWEIYRYCWESVEPSAVSGSSDEEETCSKNPEKSKLPKKRWPWTEEMKQLVHEIGSARRQYFKILRPRKETIDTFVANFMDLKVKPLFPPGFVRLSTLLKYANLEPVAKKKPKKPKEALSSNDQAPSGNSMQNCTVRLESSTAIEKDKVFKSSKNGSTVGETIGNSSAVEVIKIHDGNEKKQQVSKSKETRIKESYTSQHEKQQQQESAQQASANNSSVGKISLVPTSQLMAQKPKDHVDKFNLMDLTSSSLSITRVSDCHKISKIPEPKKDVVSITPYSESLHISSKKNEIASSGHLQHRQDLSSYSTSSSYPLSEDKATHKQVSLKHRLPQEADSIVERRNDDKDIDKQEKRDKKKDRAGENKSKLQDIKKRKKDHKERLEQTGGGGSSSEGIVPIPQSVPSLSKEEQEQRQIEETVAATNFLSQIINDDSSARHISDKRKDGEAIIDDNIGLMQATEQEKDVQMVMRSVKELQELQEMMYSPSSSPIGGIQKPNKSASQYLSYQDDYQRLYIKKEDNARSKDESHW